MTLGGDQSHYFNDAGTPTADMLLVKLLIISIISTEGANFMISNISNFYLNTPLKSPKYVHIRLCNVPNEILKKYKLSEKVGDDGYITWMSEKRCMAYHMLGC